MQPRILHLRDISRYLGLSLARFNQEIRPYISEIFVNGRRVGFDRLELDAWMDHYYYRRNNKAKE